jgi:uncharacterized protein involved in exopolysaccharide biosynthesis
MSRQGMSQAWQETQLDTGRFERMGAAPISARVTLRDLLTIAYHDRKRIGAALLLGLLLTLLLAAAMPKKYTAEASLLLRLGREYLYVPETGDPSTAQPLPYDREQTLVAEAKILTSRDVLESVVAAVGVANIYPKITENRTATEAEQAEAAKALGRAIKADLLKGSNLLQVGFSHPDADVSARVLDQIIDSYLMKRRDVFSSASNGQAEAELGARRIQLNTAEARLASFKQERGIRSFLEEQTLLLAQRSEIEKRQTEINLALAQADGRRSALSAQLGQLPAEVRLQSETARGEAAEAARKLLLDLQLKERDASSKFFDGEAQVQDIRADIERVNAHLRMLEASPPQSVRTGRSPVRDGAESDLVRSAADLSQSRSGLAALAAQRAAVDKRLSELANSESELRTLERERRLAEVQYEAAVKRLRDERVLTDLDAQRKSNVSVVQRPAVPTQAESKRSLVLVLGIVLSMGMAVLVAFLSALWRDTFLTPADVQRELGLPLLGAIPAVAR